MRRKKREGVFHSLSKSPFDFPANQRKSKLSMFQMESFSQSIQKQLAEQRKKNIRSFQLERGQIQLKGNAKSMQKTATDVISSDEDDLPG